MLNHCDVDIKTIFYPNSLFCGGGGGGVDIVQDHRPTHLDFA